MKQQPTVGVQPQVMQWARETIGLSVSDVAQRLKRSEEEIASWEAGESAPSYTQLEKLAYEVYKRPLAVFFLPAPPEELAPEREFRTLPLPDLINLAPDTHVQIRRAQAFLIGLKDLFASTNPSGRQIWRDIVLDRKKPVKPQAEWVRAYLGISLPEQIGWVSAEQALKKWREAVEDVGIFVFKASFKQKDISGFCLRDEGFPLIYLNNSTTKTRQTFSLVHELAHLLLQINGISKFDFQYIERLPSDQKELEYFCNAIAAEVLVPADDFREQSSHLPQNIEQVSDHEIESLATRYSVSRETVLRRFLDQRRVSLAFYREKATEWANQRKPSTGGGDWYATTGTYLSDRYAKEVVSRHYRQELSVEQAADFLGVKPKNFPGLEERLIKGAIP